MDSVYDLRSKRRLFVDKDIRLSDTVRNQPTAATPPQPPPQPHQPQEPAGLADIRAAFYELNDKVAKLYDDDKDKSIAKDIRCDVLGGKHVRFRARESDKGRIGDLIRRLRREFEKARLGVDVFDFNDQATRVHPAVNQFLFDVVSLVVEPGSLASLVLGGQCAEDRDGRRALVELIRFCVRQARAQRCYEHYVALRYPAETDPRPLLEEEHRLVAENDTEDWTPTTDSRRRQIFRALDRVFYKTIVDKYLVPESLAAVPLPTFIFEIVEVYLAWEDQKSEDKTMPQPMHLRYSGPEQSTALGDDIGAKLAQLAQQNVVANKRIADLEALVHGRTGGMSKPNTKRLGGFRPGMASDAERRVAFDPKDKKAKPPCPRCGPGQFHGWWHCPQGGARTGPDGGSQGEVHTPTKREVKTLALCKIFDDAAAQGPRAFEACLQRFGEPVLLEGERVLPDTRRDLSAFGFAVHDGAQHVEPGEDTSDDEDADAELSFQQVSYLPGAPRASSGMPPGRAGGEFSVTHVRLEQQEQPQPVVRSAGGAPLRWGNRQEHPGVGLSYMAADGLSYPAFPDGVEPVGAPVGANSLALAGGDADCGSGGAAGDSSETNENDDEEFEAYLAADRTAYASGKVVAAAAAVGGRACGVGRSAFTSCMPKWLMVTALLLCVTAVRALQASGGLQPGGAYSPAGFHTEWSIPLERTRERFVAGGASHYPNPPFDASPPPQLESLQGLLTVTLEPDVLAAYQRGFLAALRLRDSPQEVPGAGGTASEDALQTVVPPSGGEIYELPAEDGVTEDEDEDEDEDAAAYAGAVSAEGEI
ncbi:hypothetical protein CYMTET_10740 [Cymbomonas tetramitiformis]|uniref:Uncharacterized protein n=1 Tax=Cymbomonas tetramitiformis TaxID=36881 RepID=A0AAE0GNT6_9CHLO|nr:hypothetical protein CYMTET_10740 [Cymbomonas tetramitiformis]